MPTAKKHRIAKKTPLYDRISELPSSIIESILMCLPTRDAARTSILSKKWRYSWCRIPQLVIDDTLWDVSIPTQTLRRKKLVEILYQILSLHQGPIFKFILSITGLEGCPEIDNLIVLLSRNGVEEFTVKLWLGEHYRMPSSFFSCLELRHLNLWSCLINPAPTFKGFSQLITLKLRQVDIAPKVLGSLISNCPLLVQLKLELSENMNYLEIIAPKLKSFILKSPIKCILFKNAPVLATVSLVLQKHETEEIFRRGIKGIAEYFRSIPNLEILHIDYYFIKSLCAGGVPAKITSSLIHLKFLNLTYVSLDVLDEISFVLCLMRSSPNLREIEISVYTVEDAEGNHVGEFLDVQDYSDITLNKLREVKMQYVAGTRAEMEFIKLILEKSPSLEKMVIQPMADETDEDKFIENAILKELTKFRRASPHAEVIYEDPIED